MKLPIYLCFFYLFLHVRWLSWEILETSVVTIGVWLMSDTVIPYLLHCSIPIHQFFFLMTVTRLLFSTDNTTLFSLPPSLLPYLAFCSFSSWHAKGLLTQSENNMNFWLSVRFLRKESNGKTLTWGCLTPLKSFYTTWMRNWEDGLNYFDTFSFDVPHFVPTLAIIINRVSSVDISFFILYISFLSYSYTFI